MNIFTDSELIKSACCKDVLLPIDGMRGFVKNAAASLYKDAFENDKYTVEYDSHYNSNVKRYECLVVLDIYDNKLRSKCKMLCIETKLVLHFVFVEAYSSDTESVCEYDAQCYVTYLDALDINV